jgi:hypothetical protein
MATEAEIRAARRAAARQMMEQTGQNMMITGTQYEPTYNEPTRSLLEQFETNPAYQYQVQAPIEGGLTDDVLRLAGFSSREQYNQAMAAADAARQAGQGGFVTGGTSDVTPTATPVQTGGTNVPTGANVPTGTNVPTGNQIANTRIQEIKNWYNANVGRGDQAALDRWLATSGYTPQEINAALPQWGVADLQAAINQARSKLGMTTTGTTGTGAYDPQALFQAIYGRQGTADEVAALAGKSEADARAILEQSISRFQNTQFPFRGAQMFTPDVVGQPTMQDRFQQIYGRPGTAQEVANLAGMSDDQVRAVLTGALAQYRFDQPAQQTIARDLQQYVSMAPGSQFNPFYGGGVSPYQRVMGQMPAFQNPYANVPINAPLGGFDPLLYERRLPIATAGENYYVTNLIDGSTGGDSGGVGDSGGGGDGGGGMGNTGEGGPDGVGGWAMGGLIDRVGGANPPGPDDGLGMLQLGEYVIKKSSVNKYGKGLLDAINAGKPAKKIKSLLD